MELRIFTEPQQGATYDELLAVAQLTESLGFDAFFRSDHFLRIGEGAGEPGPTDSWVTLGALARETSRIRLGTLVTSATFRHPGPLAIAIAQVDAMSGGRVELGLGAGWYDDEHRAYGIPFPSTGERFDRLEEQLQIVTGLWSTPAGERFSFTGRHYEVVDSPALPKPVQSPRPPVIMGGFGARRTPALAARFADEFNMPWVPPEVYVPQQQRVAAACEAVGRDPSTMVWSVALETCCGSDDAEVARRAAVLGQPLESLRTHGAAGTPEEVVARLRDWVEVGVSRVYLRVMDHRDLDHVRLLGEAVLPQVAG